jgi:hypothetical protein
VNVDSAVSAVADGRNFGAECQGVLFGTTLKAEMGSQFCDELYSASQVPFFLAFFSGKEFNCVLAIVTDFQTVVTDVG